jgi:hypothetical protein
MIPQSRCPRPVRCSLAREGTCWSASAGFHERAARTPLAHVDPSSEELARRMGVKRVLAPAGKHVRGSEASEGVSTFRIVLQKSFDDAVPKDAVCAHHAPSERGLAQSGRPRRAKWHRGSSRGGKIARSAPAFEGARKGVAVVGLRSMKGASGRGCCSFFTNEQNKRSWPNLPEALARNRQRSKAG